MFSGCLFSGAKNLQNPNKKTSSVRWPHHSVYCGWAERCQAPPETRFQLRLRRRPALFKSFYGWERREGKAGRMGRRERRGREGGREGGAKKSATIKCNTAPSSVIRQPHKKNCVFISSVECSLCQLMKASRSTCDYWSTPDGMCSSTFALLTCTRVCALCLTLQSSSCATGLRT